MRRKPPIRHDIDEETATIGRFALELEVAWLREQLPDIVAGGRASLALSLEWMRRTLCLTERVLIPVQDGMVVDDVRPFLGHSVGVFVGGDPRTNWKEETVPMWATACRAAGAWCHVGRVNSQRRIHLCAAAGATSVDGTSATKYAVELPKLHRAIAQPSFTFDMEPRK